jgi:hypothetical protein
MHLTDFRNARQQRRAFDFLGWPNEEIFLDAEHKKSFHSACSLFSASSAFFSNQSPRNTSNPPEIATSEIKNSPISHDNEDKTAIEIIF